jgi:SMC interacting uncharacterized protein involved in chromosome segregation
MELDTRKNEARTELKHMDIEIEVRPRQLPLETHAEFISAQELLNRTVVTVSELRTDVEEMKWDITRKAVGTSPPYRTM